MMNKGLRRRHFVSVRKRLVFYSMFLLEDVLRKLYGGIVLSTQLSKYFLSTERAVQV